MLLKPKIQQLEYILGFVLELKFLWNYENILDAALSGAIVNVFCFKFYLQNRRCAWYASMFNFSK